MGMALKIRKDEEYILRALPALLEKDIRFRREVTVILSEVFSTKGEIKEMFEKNRIYQEEALQRLEKNSDFKRDVFLKKINDEFDLLMQQMGTLDSRLVIQGQELKELDIKFDAQGQAIKKELDSKFETQGQAIKELDTKVDKLDTKVEQLDTKVEQLDAKVEQLDAKVEQLDTKVEQLDTKFNHLDTKVDTQGQAIKNLDIKVDKLTIKLDTLGARWGIFAESTIRNTLRELLTKHLDVDEIVEWKVHDKDGIVFGYPQDVQIDFLVKNGTEYLGEIKSSAGSADVTVLSRKAKFYTQITGKCPKVLLVAVDINEEAKKSCAKLNIQFITHDDM